MTSPDGTSQAPSRDLFAHDPRELAESSGEGLEKRLDGSVRRLYPDGAQPFPPLDIPYLAASLTQAERPVSVIEAGALRLSADTFLG